MSMQYLSKCLAFQTGDEKDVVELTDSNFNELVLESNDLWLVEFFAPWCGHCKNLAPEWARAASELKGKVKLGALDATVHTVMAGRYGVSRCVLIQLVLSEIYQYINFSCVGCFIVAITNKQL